MKIGIIKERKTPPDERVPFSPEQCKRLMDQYPNISVVVEPSDVRCFSDADYTNAGIELANDLSDCDVLMGVKEVPKDRLIPSKTYFFFSHTIKEQPYNRQLLQTMLAHNIRMIDYETLTFPHGGRILGFGRYAGIVGAYNGLLAYGQKTGAFNLKPAHLCKNRADLEGELYKAKLPKNYKIVVTGTGRVGQGALEILKKCGIQQVDRHSFLNDYFDEAVFCQLDVDDYYKRDDGASFDMSEFFNNPEGHTSTFIDYAKVANMYIACHYWDSRAPFIFTREDMRNPAWNIDLVADISCDIDGPVACTLRPSTIANPLYGYDPLTEKEVSFDDAPIGVMAVDNLPCELPADASTDFGNNLLDKVMPALIGSDFDQIIERATICENGELTKYFSYLSNYVAQTS
jgi:alanine dehydrogenase